MENGDFHQQHQLLVYFQLCKGEAILLVAPFCCSLFILEFPSNPQKCIFIGLIRRSFIGLIRSGAEEAEEANRQRRQKSFLLKILTPNLIGNVIQDFVHHNHMAVEIHFITVWITNLNISLFSQNSHPKEKKKQKCIIQIFVGKLKISLKWVICIIIIIKCISCLILF